MKIMDLVLHRRSNRPLNCRDLTAAFLVFGLAGFNLTAAAQSGRALYGCIGDNGKRNFYTSEKSETSGKNCMVVEEKISSAAAPAAPSRTAAAAPQIASAATSSAAGASRIDAPTQRSRDDVRRKILVSELDDEEKRLIGARQKLGEQQSLGSPEESRNRQKMLDRLKPFIEAVEQHEKNIVELRKTLSASK